MSGCRPEALGAELWPKEVHMALWENIRAGLLAHHGAQSAASAEGEASGGSSGGRAFKPYRLNYLQATQATHAVNLCQRAIDKRQRELDGYEFSLRDILVRAAELDAVWRAKQTGGGRGTQPNGAAQGDAAMWEAQMLGGQSDQCRSGAAAEDAPRDGRGTKWRVGQRVVLLGAGSRKDSFSALIERRRWDGTYDARIDTQDAVEEYWDGTFAVRRRWGGPG